MASYLGFMRCPKCNLTHKRRETCPRCVEMAIRSREDTSAAAWRIIHAADQGDPVNVPALVEAFRIWLANVSDEERLLHEEAISLRFLWCITQVSMSGEKALAADLLAMLPTMARASKHVGATKSTWEAKLQLATQPEPKPIQKLSPFEPWTTPPPLGALVKCLSPFRNSQRGTFDAVIVGLSKGHSVAVQKYGGDITRYIKLSSLDPNSVRRPPPLHVPFYWGDRLPELGQTLTYHAKNGNTCLAEVVALYPYSGYVDLRLRNHVRTRGLIVRCDPNPHEGDTGVRTHAV